MIAPNRLGHDKFAVLSDAAGKPMAVLTGSTNWTETGLCTQANNVLVVRDRTVAGWYRDAWQRLHDAGSATPDTLVSANSQLNTIASGGRTTSAWLTPVRKLIDLEDAARRIDAATQGVLFLMFNPGPSGTLLNTILARGDPTSPTYDRDLYVNGVLNGDPSTKKRPVVLYHRGEPSRLSFDVVLPAAVGTDPLRFWVPELKQLAGTHAMVHSKVIVVDPFGPAPVVMTGSHNMGPKASGRNDDNLVIVDGDARLAEAYAVTIISIYAQYRWRQRLAQGSKWRGLHDNDRWQGTYFQAPDLLAESRFWLGG
jgi:phosphatidylserine/phosphatidylglycerophosphate/cardiolipin synthase-like enzyme